MVRQPQLPGAWLGGESSSEVARPGAGLQGMPSQAWGLLSHLEEQLVFGDPLDWLQQVGVQAQLVVQFLLAFLQPPHLGLDSVQESLLESQLAKESVLKRTWKNGQSEHCLHRLSERGLF